MCTRCVLQRSSVPFVTFAWRNLYPPKTFVEFGRRIEHQSCAWQSYYTENIDHFISGMVQMKYSVLYGMQVFSVNPYEKTPWDRLFSLCVRRKESSDSQAIAEESKELPQNRSFQGSFNKSTVLGLVVALGHGGGSSRCGVFVGNL